MNLMLRKEKNRIWEFRDISDSLTLSRKEELY
jgi:hypothetical protein